VLVQPVPEAHAVEVDTPADLLLVRALAPLTDAPAAAGARAPLDVDALVTDFDGVHTDDSAMVDQDGRETVKVSRSDGMGIALLRRAGVPVLILSTEVNPVVAARAAKLPERVAYVGNDVNDLGCMSLVGWSIAVAGAHPRVLQAARSVLAHPGGAGAVREVCERILLTKEETA
jgi:N-acylneuraminate cytidylyltransferase